MSSEHASTLGDRGEPLDELVGRTRGPQPWRKLVHAASGVTIAAALTALPLTRAEAISVAVVALVIASVLDFVRLRNEDANRLFFRAFSSLASPREATGVASSTWYVLGVLLAVALFPRAEAVSGVLILGLADPLASWIGRRWGTRPFLGGTLLGSATFLAVTLGILAFRHPLPVAAAAAFVTTLTERRSWPLDDNLTIPIVTAAILTGLGRLF